MRIGILSDTHDNIQMVDAAVKRLNEEQVSLTLHAGDYVSPFVIPRLANLQSPLIGVLGNNDGDHHLLAARFAEHEHLCLRGRFAEITAGGLTIGLLHGDERELLQALIGQGLLTLWSTATPIKPGHAASGGDWSSTPGRSVAT